jgi:hypothetical protein
MKVDGAIVAFRPLKAYSEDYAAHEYGVTPEELDVGRKARRLKPFTGKLKRGQRMPSRLSSALNGS